MKSIQNLPLIYLVFRCCRGRSGTRKWRAPWLGPHIHIFSDRAEEGMVRLLHLGQLAFQKFTLTKLPTNEAWMGQSSNVLLCKAPKNSHVPQVSAQTNLWDENCKGITWHYIRVFFVPCQGKLPTRQALEGFMAEVRVSPSDCIENAGSSAARECKLWF